MTEAEKWMNWEKRSPKNFGKYLNVKNRLLITIYQIQIFFEYFIRLSSENKATVDERITDFVRDFDFEARETTFEVLDERISQAEIQKKRLTDSQRINPAGKTIY